MTIFVIHSIAILVSCIPSTSAAGDTFRTKSVDQRMINTGDRHRQPIHEQMRLYVSFPEVYHERVSQYAVRDTRIACEKGHRGQTLSCPCAVPRNFPTGHSTHSSRSRGRRRRSTNERSLLLWSSRAPAVSTSETKTIWILLLTSFYDLRSTTTHAGSFSIFSSLIRFLGSLKILRCYVT